MSDNFFSNLSDDIILNILHKLEEDPRNWARIACVSSKFSALIRTVCCRAKCSKTIPAVVSDLFPAPAAEPSGGWASLYKLAVCCPGLLQSGVLLENSDFGLERELGPDEQFLPKIRSERIAYPSSSGGDGELNASGSDCAWSLYDDLFLDTVYNDSECKERVEIGEEQVDGRALKNVKPAADSGVCKKRKICRPLRSHLASGVWNLSREQGNKLLASRFKGDCLYICDWPGCVHVEEKRNYMLFRGIFKNFKQSRVWRTINDGNRTKIDVNCAFCCSKKTWDLHSSFCLRRYFGYHDDGEPVVRAYVCENGHVSGAWTDWPLYT
ncbi:phytochrome A-associated F-box protein [Dorcoceras hygrometricum]|uniref:Phytochrome A-associated F-box protein n=1 Tax=Dorcoceras hygrometricum TaxID=472368 RepID=A0A2Z7BHC7_9LAMI|nr:phytochrome A-associated F-box protein [Dorcoceras hygrometricum]